MTPEFEAALILRLRARYGFTERHCSDKQLIQFARTEWRYYVIIFQLRCHIFKTWVFRVIGCSRSFEEEYIRYKLYYETARGRNLMLGRRIRAYRGHLSQIRREHRENRQKGRNEG